MAAAGATLAPTLFQHVANVLVRGLGEAVAGPPVGANALLATVRGAVLNLSGFRGDASRVHASGEGLCGTEWVRRGR